MNRFLSLIVIVIALVTVISGTFQMISPQSVMTLIHADKNPASMHFFGIIGMFMLIFGGLMLHVVYHPKPQRPAILWCALQKLGASAAVGLGILNGIFSILAAGVALFDLASGLIYIYYYNKVR